MKQRERIQARGPVTPEDPRHAIRGRYAAPLWHASHLAEGLWVMVGWATHGAIARSMGELAEGLRMEPRRLDT